MEDVIKKELMLILDTIQNELIIQVNQFSVENYLFSIHFVLGLVLSLVAGWLIGSDREKKNKPAGVTTHTLVIIGSMLFTVISQLTINGDPTRIAAQIVSGIGFLGAGIILKNKNNVEYLTTAAGIWVAAAIGMAIGYRLYLIALLTTVVVAIGVHLLPHSYKKNDNEKS